MMQDKNIHALKQVLILSLKIYASVFIKSSRKENPTNTNCMRSRCCLTSLAHPSSQMLPMLLKWNNSPSIKSRPVWTQELIRKWEATTTHTATRKTRLLEAMARARQGRLTKCQMREQDQWNSNRISFPNKLVPEIPMRFKDRPMPLLRPMRLKAWAKKAKRVPLRPLRARLDRRQGDQTQVSALAQVSCQRNLTTEIWPIFPVVIRKTSR